MNSRAITMTINHIRVAWLIMAIVCAIAAMGRPARAQVVIEPQNQEKAAPQFHVLIHDKDFDKWFFNSLGGKDAARLRLESNLATRVEKIAGQCELTKVQKKKLLLAGRGDIKRWFDRVEEMGIKLDSDTDDQKRFWDLLEELRPLRLDSTGDVFGAGSLFAKTLKTTLTDEQKARSGRAARDGALSRHRATTRWVVATLDTILELSSVQHGQLEALLVEQTRPPRYFGEYDYYGVLYQASKLPETKIKSILNDRQWAQLSKHIAESKRLLPTLKAGGFIPDDDVAAAPGSNDDPAGKQRKKRG
jgi:hypothetical protein